MEVPEAKGTYILIATLRQAKSLGIGRLGVCYMAPGFSMPTSAARLALEASGRDCATIWSLLPSRTGT